MNRMKYQIFRPALIAVLFFSAVAFSSCEKYDRNIEGDVEVYLLDEYTKKAESSAISDEGIVLGDTPVLYYSDIISYDPDNFTYEIKAEAAERLKDLYQSAFAVTISGEIVYTAYFWSALSSQIVDWVVTDLVTVEISNRMKVELGYPYLMEGMDIPDKRNDDRLLSVFARDGKLKE